jgi:phosphoribosylpyrophosphate synthetase
MRKLVLLSTEVFWNSQTNSPYEGIVDALKTAKTDGSRAILISNRRKPEWLDDRFDFIEFLQRPGRQSGAAITRIVEFNRARGLSYADVLVLGATDTDLQMAVNSQTLLIRCEWVSQLGQQIKRYGVPFSKPQSIPQVIRLLENEAPWYFHYESDFLDIRALTNAGTYSEVDRDAIRLIKRLRECLKEGSRQHYKAFNLHLLSGLCKTEIFREAHIWTYYPSSDSDNSGREMMAGFCTTSRETFKRQIHGPVFVRHKASPKRHIGAFGDRTDPSSQLNTIHINPNYQGRLKGKTVVVMDDYLTYGVSFGVAAALLEKADASKVLCVAMGKFGDRAGLYNIRINTSNIYQPITSYTVSGYHSMPGKVETEAPMQFLRKFKALI